MLILILVEEGEEERRGEIRWTFSMSFAYCVHCVVFGQICLMLVLINYSACQSVAIYRPDYYMALFVSSYS